MNKQVLLLLLFLLLQIEISHSATINLGKRNFYLIQYQSQPSSAQQITPSYDPNSYSNQQSFGSQTRSVDENNPFPSSLKNSSNSSATNNSANKTVTNSTSTNSTTSFINTTNTSSSNNQSQTNATGIISFTNGTNGQEENSNQGGNIQNNDTSANSGLGTEGQPYTGITDPIIDTQATYYPNGATTQTTNNSNSTPSSGSTTRIYYDPLTGFPVTQTNDYSGAASNP